nr:class I adenylate-forming enzyme family protein [uncultured Tolumonas sp.]
MNIVDVIRINKDKTPDKIAIYIGDVSVTYLELISMVVGIASSLNKKGINKGTHVATFLTNSLECVVTMLALADLGAVWVPLIPNSTQDVIKTAINSADVTYVISDNRFTQEEKNDLIQILALKDWYIFDSHYDSDWQKFINEENGIYSHNVDPDIPYILTMTSGSTGNPKPIVFSQTTKLNRSFGAKKLYRLSENDVILAATPLYHSLAQRLTLLPLLLGGTAVVMKTFSPSGWLDAVSNYKVTFTIAVSNQLELILNSPDFINTDKSSLKIIVSSSALLKKDMKKALINSFSCDFHECYGASEVGTVTNLSPKDATNCLNSVGKAFGGISIIIRDESGDSVSTGEIGEITVKSPTAFLGYYNLPEVNSLSVKNGYFYTGDLGYLDSNGFLYFSGRKKEIIITSGMNIYPVDIESVLLTHPDVLDAAVFGIDDAILGEAVVAAVVLKDKKQESMDKELRKWCRGKLLDYQKPLKFFFVDELPKTSLGKIQRNKLKNYFQ